MLRKLTENLRAAYGERLISIVLYGSGAAGDRHAAYSDLNILCVLDRITPAEMRASGEVFRWWRKHGNPSPLLLTEQELRSSTDAFAIEFHDIRASRRVLWGQDFFADLEVDDSFYRARVEHELRAKLLRLRQKAAGMMADEAPLRRLLVDSVSVFCVLFRHALLLQGVDPGTRKRDILARAEAAFGIDAAPVTKLLDIREGLVKPRDLHPAAVLPAYLAAISTVIEAVDHLGK
ncbi:MAG: hypothetical protein M1436_08900 [Acidobacteria bacterium]|nr:hypothetical protein [Acidobacteriota bacterium]